MKILLVDDFEALAQSCRERLCATIESLSVTLCHNGNEALEVFKKQGPFDVVVTDQLHEGLSGVNLVRAIRKRRPKQPCIIYTYDPNLPELTQPPCPVVRKRVARHPGEELVNAVIEVSTST